MHVMLAVALLVAPGDRDWVEDLPEQALIAANRTALADTVAAIWPSIAPLGFRLLHCSRDLKTQRRPNLNLRCGPNELRTGTSVDFDNAERSPPPRGFVKFVSEVAGVFTWLWSPGYKDLSPPEAVALGSWSALIWSGVPINSVVSLLAKVPDGAAVMDASIRQSKTGNRAQYQAALKSGKVTGRN